MLSFWLFQHLRSTLKKKKSFRKWKIYVITTSEYLNSSTIPQLGNQLTGKLEFRTSSETFFKAISLYSRESKIPAIRKKNKQTKTHTHTNKKHGIVSIGKIAGKKRNLQMKIPLSDLVQVKLFNVNHPSSWANALASGFSIKECTPPPMQELSQGVITPAKGYYRHEYTCIHWTKVQT